MKTSLAALAAALVLAAPAAAQDAAASATFIDLEGLELGTV